MAADHFCLIWNNFQNSILSALGNLQSSQDLVDVTLMCEGRNVRAHKVILSACSPYFRNLFKETPCQHPVIILKDVSHYDLTALLQFMYQGEVMVTQDCLASFLKTAELLQISGLAGTAAAASALDPTDPLPKAPPDLMGTSPDSPGTAINKINSDLSLTKQKGRDKVDKDSAENKLPSFSEQTDPQQSCSYQTPNVAIKTESLDRDYDDMDTEPSDHRDNDEHFDNTSGHSEEPSILERSLKAQSGFLNVKHNLFYEAGSSNTDDDIISIDQHTDANILKIHPVQSSQEYRNRTKNFNYDIYPSRKPAVCPVCNKRVAQARYLRRHLQICPVAVERKNLKNN